MTTLRDRFMKAATWHGDIAEAEAMIAEHPELRNGDIHLAAIQGDAEAVTAFLAQDRDSAILRNGPYGADPLNYLGLSKYLRLDLARSDGFVRAATALLDAGADPNTGFWTTGNFPEFETALYGAAGVAHHAPLTKLLIERGADPNDEEVCYHSPEEYDLAAMQVVVETGRVRAENLALMLIRKHDWHDYNGIKYLLEHGADPNLIRGRGPTPMNHAIERDNDISIFVLLLDHGANPILPGTSGYGIAQAARRGRGDLLDIFEARGFRFTPGPLDALIIACAKGDAARAQALAAASPDALRDLLAEGPRLLATFAGNNNAAGIDALLALGLPVGVTYDGDGYWDIARDSTALHVAAWRAMQPALELLLMRGAPVDVADAKGRTPLMMAVKATVDSYWMRRRSPDGVKALLDAGASIAGVTYPCGYAEIDALLATRA